MLLIFPLFFGMGWLAARIDIKELLSESSTLPRSYFEGLNFLLNDIWTFGRLKFKAAVAPAKRD